VSHPKTLPRPNNCPVSTGACGLRTLAASQIGTICALILGLIFYLWHILGVLRGSDEDVVITELFWAILFLTALYYAIAEWLLEEQDFQLLHTLVWPTYVPSWIRNRKWLTLAGVEFWIRALLVSAFGVAAAGIPEPLRLGLSPIHSSFFVLSIIYLLFLFWDLIVCEGGQIALAWRVVWGDLMGALLTLSCLWTHRAYPRCAGLLFIMTLIFIALLFSKVSKKIRLLTRIGNRALLR